MKYVRMSALLSVLFALCAPAAAQWQVPNGAVPLGRGGGAQGFGSAAGSVGTGLKCLTDATPPVFAACPGAPTGKVRIMRVLPPPTTPNTATWAAYGPQGNQLCSGSNNSAGLMTCVQTAINTAFPYALATTASGYDFEIIGGDEPALGRGTNYGGAAAVLLTPGPIQFPPMQSAKIRSGAITLGAVGNDTLVFNACMMCDIDFSGAQVVYDSNTSTTGMALRFKPTQPTPVDGSLGVSPVRAFFTTIVGRVRYDMSGHASANFNFLNLHIVESNFNPLVGGCGFLVDSPATGQNMVYNYTVIDQLHGAGTIGTAFCSGTQAAGAGALFGNSYINVGITFDSAGPGNGYDEWASGNEIHLRAGGITSGYTLKFEPGACRNTAFIVSNQTTPVITDASGCTGVNANTWYVNGTMNMGGAGAVSATPACGICLSPGVGWAASSGNLAAILAGTMQLNITTFGPRVVAGSVLGWSSSTANTSLADTGLSRDSAGVIDFGNGTAADKSATLQALVLRLGVSGASQGSVQIGNATAGTATITNAANGGNPVIQTPNTSGTVAVSASAPLLLNGVTGNLTLSSIGTSANTPTMTYEGDSITAGSGGTHPYNFYITPPTYNGLTFTQTNIGVPGSTVVQMQTAAATNLDPLYHYGSGLNAVMFLGGVNDLLGGASVAQTYSNIVAFAKQQRPKGFPTLVGTLTSACNTGTVDADRAAVNALIYANWPQFADGLVDFAGNANIGAIGACNNTTYFGDKLHPTDAGYTIMGSIAQTAWTNYVANLANVNAVTLSLGLSGRAQGSIVIGNATSGSTTITNAANGGAPTIQTPNTSGTMAVSASAPLVLASGTGNLTLGTVGIANGGTNCTSASITCFNNITGFTASGATGTTSGSLVFSASPTLTGTVTAANILPAADNTGSLGSLTGPFRWQNIVGVNIISAGSMQSASGHGIPAGGDGTGITVNVSTFGMFYGSGVPTMSAGQGSVYLRTDGIASNRFYVNNNGSTGWTAY